VPFASPGVGGVASAVCAAAAVQPSSAGGQRSSAVTTRDVFQDTVVFWNACGFRGHDAQILSYVRAERPLIAVFAEAKVPPSFMSPSVADYVGLCKPHTSYASPVAVGGMVLY